MQLNVWYNNGEIKNTIKPSNISAYTIKYPDQ